MNIAFVEPGNTFEGFTFGWINRMFMLGPIGLGTILHNKGHNVQVYKENLSPPDYSKLDVDVLGIYSMTSTAKRGYSIARKVKQRNPKTKIIIGGPHASFMTEEAKKYADVVVSGEAEAVISDIVNNKLKQDVINTGICTDLNKVPPTNFSLMKGIKTPLDPMPIQTSRGCPFNCNFCSVTKMFGKEYRVKKTDLVINEMLNNKYKRMYIYDDNFCAIKSRSKEIMGQMKEHSLTRPWMAQTRLEIANDPEMLRMMSDTNCEMLSIGIESINQKTLKLYNKSLTAKDIKKNIKTIHDYGITLHGMFVLGSDEDDLNTIQQTKDFCDETELRFPQMSILTPVPGTEIFQELDKQGRIFTKDWDLYDFNRVVFKPKKMSAFKLQEKVTESFRDLYWLRKRGFRLWFENFDYAARMIQGARKWWRQNQEYLEFLSRLSL